jgi:hypothetical protein
MSRATSPWSRRALPGWALPLVALALASPLCAAAQPAPADATAAPPEASAAPPAQAEAPESKRAVYLPESLKAQFREEIRQEVFTRAREEGWAAPNVVPTWLQRLRLAGDVRVRFDRTAFPPGNASGGEFPDFAAINAGSPFDVNFVDLSGERYLDVDQGRTRFRLRARLGVDAEVAPLVTSGIRIATGEGNSPVSTNQTLGGSGGSFSKYPIWLDRAWLRVGTRPEAPGGWAVEAGRFATPFFSTDLTWSDTVNFDGIAALGRRALGSDFAVFGSGGAFPLYTTAFAFPAERSAKFPSRNKWLYAAQLGGEWRPTSEVAVKLAAAFYDFDRIEGAVSGPCDTNLKNITCSTDDSRPSFAQKGNTYLALRTPSDAALVAEALGSVSRYQYFGLASRFRELAVTGRIEVPAGQRLKVTVDAEAVWNLGFKASQVGALALNNRAKCDTSGCTGFDGGGVGFMARLTLGSPGQGSAGSWSSSLAYRHLESDAAVDAFTDPDFGLGGTNLQGYMLSATWGVLDQLSLTVRWMSADAIAGPTYRVDVLNTDIQVRF